MGGELCVAEYRVELERFSAGSVDSVLDLWAQVSVGADIGA